MKKRIYYIREFGVISKESSSGAISSLDRLSLPAEPFDDIYQYILEQQEKFENSELPFLLYAKAGQPRIKVKNYVGIIETTNHIVLEILPKITLSGQRDELAATKEIFYKMLRHLKDSPFLSLDEAHLRASNQFPVLEVFIKAYLNAVSFLCDRGLKSGYIEKTENLPFLKGKLNLTRNIQLNTIDKSKFFCVYSKFELDTSFNRVIKTTLLKLNRITGSLVSAEVIKRLLVSFNEIPASKNIEKDLIASKFEIQKDQTSKVTLSWSELFLADKGFTNFEGNHINLAILFPMERVFEDYIAYLLNKHSEGFTIKAQDKHYFLVENHINKSRFQLKPDLVVSLKEVDKVIVDTKWKILNETKAFGNYNLSQGDMYQLYAYGKKYSRIEEKPPGLLLIYPANEHFTKVLPDFVYENGLTLVVRPFHFDKDEKAQILAILS